jgi:NTP pyrophosphatase (non-canonical NTP hydrolase)
MKLDDLQRSIKEHDFQPDNINGYFLKLIEEVGELSEAIRKDRGGQPNIDSIKGTVAEELNDVLYYVCALANVHGIDLTETYQLKEKLNKVKYER